MQALIRKVGHVLDDPVLRRWLVRRAVGLEKPPPAFTAGQPPYLGAHGDHVPTKLGALAVMDFPTGKFLPPSASIRIDLAGTTVDLAPEKPTALFAQPYEDLETLLAAHRFAWVPVAGVSVDADWVALLWQTWISGFGDVTSGWPWHAYTAAERAINIIDFSRRFGLPGDLGETSQILARHADIIRGNLEYFGEHYTSNHLSNNGRGLLRIGTALGRADHADTGAQIMVAEAGRIFGRSGVLREGSTHYHLLVTRNYIDAWLDAHAAGLDAAGLLRDIAQRALAVIPGLCLPGGMPLVGDISPDIPPASLGRLLGADEDEGWPANLPDDRQRDALGFIDENIAVSPDKLAADGWHRFGGHRWQALAFVSPDGWPPMPGHGHEDLGSFELHDGERPIIVDPGRGSYDDMNYANAQLHNYLTIDDAGPTAVNRPYYSADYRDRVIGAAPSMSRTRAGGILTITGFGRLNGVGNAVREWRFLEDRLEILDRVEGSGTHRVQRRFHTTADSRMAGTGAMLDFEGAEYNLSSDCQPTVTESVNFGDYGQARPGYQIMFDQIVSLPFVSVTVIGRL
jgi:hypothetical protein